MLTDYLLIPQLEVYSASNKERLATFKDVSLFAFKFHNKYHVCSCYCEIFPFLESWAIRN